MMKFATWPFELAFRLRTRVVCFRGTTMPMVSADGNMERIPSEPLVPVDGGFLLRKSRARVNSPSIGEGESEWAKEGDVIISRGCRIG